MPHSGFLPLLFLLHFVLQSLVFSIQRFLSGTFSIWFFLHSYIVLWTSVFFFLNLLSHHFLGDFSFLANLYLNRRALSSDQISISFLFVVIFLLWLSGWPLGKGYRILLLLSLRIYWLFPMLDPLPSHSLLPIFFTCIDSLNSSPSKLLFNVRRPLSNDFSALLMTLSFDFFSSTWPSSVMIVSQDLHISATFA